MDYYATNTSIIGTCQVGSGTATPANSDTALVNKIAASSSVTTTTGINGSSPYYTSNPSVIRRRSVYSSWIRKVYTFTTGAAAGNLSEVGVGWGSTGNLFSRALILDGVGSPTTLTILSDESLQVTYELRFYVPETDVTGTITLDGVDYDWTARAADCASYSTSGWYATSAGIVHGTPSLTYAYDGAIAAITSHPTGTASNPNTFDVATYVSGNYYCDFTIYFGLSTGNLGSGISSLLYQAAAGKWQIGFSPAIPKDNTKELSLTIRHAFSRKSI